MRKNSVDHMGPDYDSQIIIIMNMMIFTGV